MQRRIFLKSILPAAAAAQRLRHNPICPGVDQCWTRIFTSDRMRTHASLTCKAAVSPGQSS